MELRKLGLFGIVFILLCSFASAEYLDDFNRANSNNLGQAYNLQTWLESDGAGGAVTSIDTNEFKIVDPDGDSHSASVARDYEAEDIRTVEFKARDTGNTSMRIYLVDAADNIMFGARLEEDDIDYLDNTGWVKGADVTAGKNYVVEFKNINYTTDTYDFYINGSLKKTGAIFQTAGVPVRINITSGVANTGTAYIDYINDSFYSEFRLQPYL